VVHMAIRKLMKYGRSLVLTVPNFAATKIGTKRGDLFVCTYDDERNTLTFQPYTVNGKLPGLDPKSADVDVVLMP
jgi:hypothetical protein